MLMFSTCIQATFGLKELLSSFVGLLDLLGFTFMDVAILVGYHSLLKFNKDILVPK